MHDVAAARITAQFERLPPNEIPDAISTFVKSGTTLSPAAGDALLVVVLQRLPQMGLSDVVALCSHVPQVASIRKVTFLLSQKGLLR